MFKNPLTILNNDNLKSKVIVWYQTQPTGFSKIYFKVHDILNP